jgi:pyruvate-formate lyase
MALNLKYTPQPDACIMAKQMAEYVEAYFDDACCIRDGGMEIQFNIISQCDLRRAMHDRDSRLLVRVSGYTAYFKDLSEAMQNEIIDRTEYELATGKARGFPPIPLPPEETAP